MNAIAASTAVREIRREALRIDGERIHRDAVIDVRNPYDGALVGTVPKATLDD
ncbi:phosphonoacetaldehyde dehydrogenase, partial [Burkholderia cenocepacia]|nr:phosphonoacetaldehyde dehydrogenase [Burkholderia cenocepacia]